jgi:transcription initiation factor TFIIF subunit alpha
LAKGRPTPGWLRKPLKQEVKNVSLGPGGRRLKAVDSGQKTKFERDDEFGSSTKARDKELGRDGDPDEMEYESDFADDDEGGAMDAMDEEEAKELEERIKREYRAAERADEPSDEEEDANQLSGVGKDMKKLFKRLDKGAAEESDKEENPYQSSVRMTLLALSLKWLIVFIRMRVQVKRMFLWKLDLNSNHSK